MRKSALSSDQNECLQTRQLKSLVFATENNSLAARISMALGCVGFQVASLTRSAHPVRKARKVLRHFAYHNRFRARSIIRAIDSWSPDIIVCTDDLAVRELQDLHKRTAAFGNGADRRRSDLIELSLGPPTSFAAMRNKSCFLALAELEGVRCPKTIVFPATRAFDLTPAELTYPVVVKADHSDGGRCVRIVNEDADLRAAVWELQVPNSWRGRRLLGTVLGSASFSPLRLPLRRTISVQEHIDGHPANRAVICWDGKVLAGISVEVLEVTYERGPASVIRLVDHPEMAAACKRLVKRLNLSGFVGFDFIIDSRNRAWLLEMNPRVTQTCHFSLADGTDLAAALYLQMKGSPQRPRPPSINRDLIALFPNEIVRSPSSNHLLSCQHDVPWEEPELVRAVLKQIRRTQIRKEARRFVECHLPAVVEGLVRVGLLGAGTASESPPHAEETAVLRDAVARAGALRGHGLRDATVEAVSTGANGPGERGVPYPVAASPEV